MHVCMHICVCLHVRVFMHLMKTQLNPAEDDFIPFSFEVRSRTPRARISGRRSSSPATAGALRPHAALQPGSAPLWL